VECPVHSIPASIPLRINDLDVGDAIHVSDVELPAGTQIHNPPDAVIVHVLAPRAEAEVAAEELEAAAEPELVGSKEETGESEGETN